MGPVSGKSASVRRAGCLALAAWTAGCLEVPAATSGAPGDASDPLPGEGLVVVRPDPFSLVPGSSFVPVPGAELDISPSADDEVWIVLASAAVSSTEFASNGGYVAFAEVRFVLDGETIGVVGATNMGPDGPLPVIHASWVTGATGRRAVTAELRASTGTATLSGLTMLAFRLPPGADFHGVIDDRLVVGDVYTAGPALTIEPARAGEYVVLFAAEGDEAPSAQSINLRVADHAAQHWPALSSDGDHWFNHRRVSRQFFTARAVALDAPAAFAVETKTDSATATASLRRARLLAFRTDAFAAFDSVAALDNRLLSSTTPTTAAELAALDDGGADRVLLQSVAVNADDGGGLGCGRTITLQAGERVLELVEYNDGRGPRTSYAAFDGLAGGTGPLTLRNQVHCDGTAVALNVAEAVIHVLTLPR
jgi:hypothetical protein